MDENCYEAEDSHDDTVEQEVEDQCQVEDNHLFY